MARFSDIAPVLMSRSARAIRVNIAAICVWVRREACEAVRASFHFILGLPPTSASAASSCVLPPSSDPGLHDAPKLRGQGAEGRKYLSLAANYVGQGAHGLSAVAGYHRIAEIEDRLR